MADRWIREARAPVADWEKDLEQRPAARFGARAYGPIPLKDPRRVYWHHLGNFFDAVRGKAKLACPPEVGFEAALSALRVNESMKAGRRLVFRPEEFKV